MGRPVAGELERARRARGHLHERLPAVAGQQQPPPISISTSLGIFVARVTGTRKLLGRTTPRIRVVGRVPLGRTRKGANRFRWNGKVNGKRLAAGTYLCSVATMY